jgi:hypothetical protein
VTDSVQLAILKALTTHLEGMTVADGYEYDMLGNVFRGRTAIGDEVSLPCLSILEAPRPDENPRSGGPEKAFRLEDWVLLVQGWVADDILNPTDPVYPLKAQVEKRLSEIISVNDRTGNPTFPALYRLGGLISEMSIGPGVVRPPQERVSSRAFFYLPVVVKIAVTPTYPFTS